MDLNSYIYDLQEMKRKADAYDHIAREVCDLFDKSPWEVSTDNIIAYIADYKAISEVVAAIAVKGDKQ